MTPTEYVQRLTERAEHLRQASAALNRAGEVEIAAKVNRKLYAVCQELMQARATKAYVLCPKAVGHRIYWTDHQGWSSNIDLARRFTKDEGEKFIARSGFHYETELVEAP